MVTSATSATKLPGLGVLYWPCSRSGFFYFWPLCFGLDNSSLWGAFLSPEGCLATSPPSTHYMPEAHFLRLQLRQPKPLQRLQNVAGSKIAMVENHCPRHTPLWRRVWCMPGARAGESHCCLHSFPCPIYRALAVGQELCQVTGMWGWIWSGFCLEEKSPVRQKNSSVNIWLTNVARAGA